MGCLFSENVEDLVDFLKDLFKNPNKVTDHDKRVLLNCFPFMKCILKSQIKDANHINISHFINQRLTMLNTNVGYILKYIFQI